MTLSCLNICHTSGVAAFPKRCGLGWYQNFLFVDVTHGTPTGDEVFFLLKSREMTINFLLFKAECHISRVYCWWPKKIKKKKIFTRVCATVNDFFFFTILSPSLSFENERINYVFITLLSRHLSNTRKKCFWCSLKAPAAVDAVVRLFNSESSSCEFVCKRRCVSCELEKEKLGSEFS